ncbi:MAG: hypothetical protein R2764_15955 [Bacteroidales bacterium]
MKTLKYTIIAIFAFLMLSLKVGDNKSVYNVPLLAQSIYSTDINNDDYIDIIIGNSYSTISEWGGVSMLENIGNGYFIFNDSMYFEHGFQEVDGNYIDENDYIDIYGRHQSNNPHKENIAIIYNYGLSQFDSVKVFTYMTIML